jgi:hypothetical protein
MTPKNSNLGNRPFLNVVKMFNLRYDSCDAVNSGQIDLNPFLDSFLYGLTGTPGTPEPVVIKSENKTK